MTTDSALNQLPLPPEDEVAALMASPAFQAQMAALTQPAMASLQDLVAALRAAEAPLAANPPPAKPIVDIPYGLAVELVLTEAVGVGGLGTGWGVKLMPPDSAAVMGAPVFRMAPSPEEIAVDMLAMLPLPAAAIAVAAPLLPAASDSSASEFAFVFEPDNRVGGEAGIV